MPSTETCYVSAPLKYKLGGGSDFDNQPVNPFRRGVIYLAD